MLGGDTRRGMILFGGPTINAPSSLAQLSSWVRPPSSSSTLGTKSGREEIRRMVGDSPPLNKIGSQLVGWLYDCWSPPPPHHLLLGRRLLLLWRELVRALGLEELALFDAVLESTAHRVLRKLDLWVRGLDVLRARWVGRVRKDQTKLCNATREVMNQVATRSSYLLDRLARRPFAVLERRDGLFDHFVVSHLRREPGARRETCGVGRSQTITPPQPSPRDLRTLIVWVV